MEISTPVATLVSVEHTALRSRICRGEDAPHGSSGGYAPWYRAPGGGPVRVLEPGQFRFDLVDTSPVVATARLVGELDLFTAPCLRDGLCELFDDGVRTVELDLSELDFIDSTGLAELVLALKRHRQRGGDVVLCRPSPSTARVLEIAGLDQVFTVSPAA